jgi:uncharacterized protein YgiM (DUF1202 family)
MNLHSFKHLAYCAAALAFFITTSYSQGAVTASGQGNLIAQVSTPEKILGQVNTGDMCTVLQIKDDWVKVSLPGKKVGWVQRGILNLPDPDAVTISRDWPLFSKRGNWNEPWDTNGPVIGHVRKGMIARRLELNAEWYEIELPDGVTGWIPQHAAATSIMDETSIKRDDVAVSDTTKKKNAARYGVEIKAGEKLIQIARGIKWVKVRTSDGKEGWLESYKLDVAAALPVGGSNAFLYRTFNTLDKLGDKNMLLGVLIFVIHWLVIPIIPGIVLWLLYYFTVGLIKPINNWFLKAGYGVVLFLFGTDFIIYFIPSIPPFMGGFTGGIMQLWSFGILIAVGLAMAQRISYDRCNKCRRIGAGEIVGSEHGGTHTSVDTTKTTYGYADGHTSTQTKETTTKSNTTWVTVRCRHCGYIWKVRETMSSSKTIVK